MAEKYVKLSDIIDTLENEWGYEGMREDLEKLPTADVVEVPCRCEKCKYCITHTCAITGIKTLFCDYEGITKPFVVEPTHFCGYGERRDTQC